MFGGVTMRVSLVALFLVSAFLLRANLASCQPQGKLETPPQEKPDQAKLAKDLNLLLALKKTLEEKPNDPTVLEDAKTLAAQLAPHLPGNRVVWQLLIKTRTLKDEMSLANAEKILG